MPGLRLADWEERTRQSNNKRREFLQIIDQCSPEARQYLFESVLPRLKENPTAINDVYSDEYFERPVKIKQFIEDPYYLGQTLGSGIYPKVKESLIELFDGNYFEVVLGGAIGWGKSTMAYIGVAYDIYLVSCIKSPAQSFGLIPGSNVAFLNVSVNKRQAQRIMFSGLFNLIKNSPYFRERFQWDKSIETELRFPRNVFAYPVAASPQAMLGEGVFSAAFDEMNFYQVVEDSRKNPEGGEFDQAFALYNLMSRRIRSRMNKRGRLPGHLWLVSSARYPNDFTERKAAEALTDPTIFVREYSDWETKPATSYMQRADGGMATFDVEVGDITRRTRVLTGEEKDVDPQRVIRVPEDYREVFTKDPDGAVRDHAGISVLTVRPFITQRHLVAEMFKYSDEHGMKHPYSEFTVTLQDASEHLLQQNFHFTEQDDLDETGKEIKKVKLAPGPYFAHVDLALRNDACGFAVGHIVGWRKVWRGVGPDRHEETKPIIRIDLVLQIVAPKYGEINIASVRGLLYALREMGMYFGMVSYDSWNSADSIQTLKSAGFTAEVFSLDRDTEGYQALKDAIYDARLLCYSHPILNRELTSVMLNEKKGKIDHTPQGSKDCSDAVAGVVYHAEQSFATGYSGEWQDVMTVQKEDTSKPILSDREELEMKIANGIPLNEDEIRRL